MHSMSVDVSTCQIKPHWIRCAHTL